MDEVLVTRFVLFIDIENMILLRTYPYVIRPADFRTEPHPLPIFRRASTAQADWKNRKNCMGSLGVETRALEWKNQGLHPLKLRPEGTPSIPGMIQVCD